jgi:hypothetical protein
MGYHLNIAVFLGKNYPGHNIGSIFRMGETQRNPIFKTKIEQFVVLLSFLVSTQPTLLCKFKHMFSNKLSKEWSYKWYGFCGKEKEYVGRFYTLEDYVDTTCPPDILEKVIAYLSNAPLALVGQVDEISCGLCGELLHPASFRSDGEWLWPDRLSHDVEKHDFCVPNAMVEHILNQNGIPPKDYDVPWEELPWP